jgi:6-phosphogluconolactonase
MADKTTTVYATSLRHDAVLSYRMDLATGALTPIGMPIEVALPWTMGRSPNGRFLYVVGHQDHAITSIEIGADGVLTHLDTMRIPEKFGLRDQSYYHVDPTNRFLLSCDYWHDKIMSYPIGADGRVDTAAATGVTVGSSVRGWRGDRTHPHSIQLDPQARYVIVPFTGKDRIEFYKWADGQIISPSIAYVETRGGTGPRHFVFHPTQPWVYFNHERGALPSRVSQFAYTPGQPGLEEKGTWPTIPSDYTTFQAIADIRITPSGRFLYVSNRGHDSLAGFAVSERDGHLEPLGQFPTGKGPTTFGIDSTGSFVVSASVGSGTLSVHRIDQTTGALSEPQVTRCDWYGTAPKKLPVRNTDPSHEPTLPAERYARDRGYGCPWVIVL